MFNLKDYNSSEEQSGEQGPVEMRVTVLQHEMLKIISNLEYLATCAAVPSHLENDLEADMAGDPVSELYLTRAKGLRALVDKDIKEVEESEAIELGASKLEQTILDWAVRYDKLKQASVELCTEYDKVRTKLVKYADTIDELTQDNLDLQSVNDSLKVFLNDYATGLDDLKAENEALKATLELKFKGKDIK